MLLNKLTPQAAMRFKKYGYLIFLLPLVLPAQSYYLAQHFEGWDTFLAFLPLMIVFGLIPLLDVLLGKDPVNPSEDEVPALSNQSYYKWLTLTCLPLYMLCMLTSAYFLATWPELSLIATLGFILSQGVVGGVIAINVGHELIHKRSKVEQVVGGLLLSLVSYGSFKVEHVYGHHVNVSTPLDASSSRYNQSLYRFLPNAYVHNFLNAWRLQKLRLAKQGLTLWSHKNELTWYYLSSLVMAITCGYIFMLSGVEFWQGVFYFIAQSFIAFTLLEIVNYIEHYGLHRSKLGNGQYERVTPTHSWNSNFFLTNMFLFQLQRHSDHHAFSARRYQVLRHYDGSPQLPFGYATMVLVALLPPLWMYIMNPRVNAYYKD